MTARDIALEVVRLLEERQAFVDTFDKEGAARFLHCSVSTLELCMKHKEIPSSRIGRAVVFRRQDLDRYLMQKQSTGIDKLLDEMIGRQKVHRRRTGTNGCQVDAKSCRRSGTV